MGHYDEKLVSPPDHIKLLIVTEAPPDKPANYFYNVSMNDYNHDSSRSFFRGIMQGIGLLGKGVKIYSERRLLDTFLANGYFLVDTSPYPVYGNAVQRANQLFEYADSLASTIYYELNPESILFVCDTNQAVLDSMERYPEIWNRILLDAPLPYPGNGWLYPRIDGRPSFIDLFPQEYILAGLY